MEDYRIVDFEKYCPTCKYFKLKENEDHCNECLSEPTNLCTETPINFEED